MRRRDFFAVLGGGIVVLLIADDSDAQESGGGARRGFSEPAPTAAQRLAAHRRNRRWSRSTPAKWKWDRTPAPR